MYISSFLFKSVSSISKRIICSRIQRYQTTYARQCTYVYVPEHTKIHVFKNVHFELEIQYFLWKLWFESARFWSENGPIMRKESKKHDLKPKFIPKWAIQAWMSSFWLKNHKFLQTNHWYHLEIVWREQNEWASNKLKVKYD